MIAKYENRYTLSQGMIKEYLEVVALKKTYNIIFTIMVADIAITLLFFLSNNYFLAKLFLTILVLISLSVIFLPRISYNKYIKNYDQSHDNHRYESIVEIGDMVRITEGKYIKNFKFSDIDKIYFLNQISVIIMSDESVIFLGVQKFSIGNYSDYKNYMLYTCGSDKIINNY